MSLPVLYNQHFLVLSVYTYIKLAKLIKFNKIKFYNHRSKLTKYALCLLDLRRRKLCFRQSVSVYRRRRKTLSLRTVQMKEPRKFVTRDWKNKRTRLYWAKLRYTDTFSAIINSKLNLLTVSRKSSTYIQCSKASLILTTMQADAAQHFLLRIQWLLYKVFKFASAW